MMCDHIAHSVAHQFHIVIDFELSSDGMMDGDGLGTDAVAGQFLWAAFALRQQSTPGVCCVK
jgi:hypothetical protein